MMERFGAWVVGEGTGGSERKDELAVRLLLQTGSIMDRERSPQLGLGPEKKS
jgi:hypothetical protein